MGAAAVDGSDQRAPARSEVAERYRELVRSSTDALVVHVDGTVVAASPPALALLGAATEDEVVGRQTFDFVAPEAVEAVTRRRDIIRSGGWPGSQRVTAVRLDGTTFAMETGSVPVLWGDEVANQITLRPVPDVAEELAAVAPTVAGSVGAPAIVTDRDLRVVAVNQAACALYGRDRAAAVGLPLHEVTRWDPTDEQVVAAGAILDDVDRWEGRMVHRSADEAELVVACSLRRLEDGEGRWIGVLVVAQPDDTAALPVDSDDDVLAADLRLAIIAGHIRVHFQPIVALHDGEVLKVEALVRWEHPEHGLIPPSEFVEVAERTGAIVELGAHVLDEACRQVAAWRRSHHPGLELSVNLSPRELADSAVADRVQQALTRHGLPPQALWLEVTETAMSTDPRGALAVLRRLRDLGVRLAIDDFGTGFANLSNLRQYPFGAVKIDRSFVWGLGVDASDLVIVRSILQLAGELGMLVVAEGVETEDQRAKLLELGCELGQGYLFSRPTAAADADAWLLPSGDDVAADTPASADVPAGPGVVHDLGLSHDRSDPLLDTVARAAAALLDVPVAAVAVDEGDGVLVVAGVAVETGAIGASALYRRTEADPMGTSVLDGDDLAVRFAGDPFVGHPGAALWAGTTIVVDATVVGVLCVADPRPRHFGAQELATLRQLGEQAAATLELRHRTLELYRVRRALTVATQQVHELTERHRAVEHVCQDMLGDVNVDGTIRSASASAANVLGHEPSAWIGRNALDLVHPDDLPTAVVSLTETAAQLGPARPIQLRLEVADGSYQPFEVTSTTFETASGGHRVFMAVRDRPGSSALMAELEWSTTVATTGFGLSEDMLVVSDEHGTVQALTPTARALHGDIRRLSLSEWADRLDLRREGGARVPLPDLPLFRALQGEAVDGSFSLLGELGDLRPVVVRAAPVRSPQGAVLGAVMALQQVDGAYVTGLSGTSVGNRSER